MEDDKKNVALAEAFKNGAKALKELKKACVRTEQDILKDFEKLGYKIIENNPNWLELVLEDENLRIEIFKADMTYTFDDYLNMQEHKLLHELFTCWGWL